MSIETEIRTELQNSTGVTGKVSTRCYHLRLPEGATLPAVTYQRISGRPMNVTYQGAIALVNHRIQVDSWAQTGEDVESLAAEVRKTLNGYSGTPSSLEVHGSFLVNEFTDYEIETQIYRVSQDYSIWHDEST